MEYAEASKFVMPLGKFKGRTVDQVGSSDEGLKYLDWLVGQDWVYGPLRDAIKSYLADPTISRALDALID